MSDKTEQARQLWEDIRNRTGEESNTRGLVADAADAIIEAVEDVEENTIDVDGITVVKKDGKLSLSDNCLNLIYAGLL